MTPFAHAIAQQLGAPVHGFVARSIVQRHATAPRWTPVEDSLLAKILDYLRLHPESDVVAVSQAVGTKRDASLYAAFQELRRHGAVESVRKEGFRKIWQVTYDYR
jgi:hypothetical protein